MTDPMEAIRDTFFQECEEQLAELEGGLLALGDGDAGPDVVHAVFRAVHSIKGGAGAFGLDALVRFAHGFETAMDAMRSGRLAIAVPVLATMLRAADVLADLVRAARTGGTVDAERSAALGLELASLTDAAVAVAAEPAFLPVMATLDAEGGGPIEDRSATPRWTIRFAPHATMYAKANDAGLLLRELGRLGRAEVALDATSLPSLDRLEPEGAYLAWTVTLETTEPVSAIRDVFEFVDGDCDLTIAAVAMILAAVMEPEIDIAALLARAQQAAPVPVAAAAVLAEAPVVEPPVVEPPVRADAPRDSRVEAAPKPTIRVDLDRVDRLIDLVGELVINQAMLAERVVSERSVGGVGGASRSSALAMSLDELEQLTRSIQDSVMAIRAQPVKSVFGRMPRLVREVAAMTGKQVRLVTEGEATEVDRTVIEHLSDPLTHMVRNAIGHGLELPAVRMAAGKPAEGTVRIAALHRSGRIVIEVGDDGAGINRARVRASAVAKGLLAADAALDDDAMDNLIFLPGFSTVDTVSDLSGRGVGMDVVRRSMEALGGRISIVSRPGLGSTFTLSLPLTLAVLDGMVVAVGGQTLVVPLTAILETLQPRPSEVHGLGAARVIAIRGSFVPLIDVGEALGFGADADGSDPASDGNRSVALLVEVEDGSHAALLVRAIHGQRQVVIKSLEANYRHVPGVAAATILGDGRVALILDVDAIVQSARRDGSVALPRATRLPTMEMIHA